MKKLITMIGAAAAAFGLYADGFTYTGSNFEQAGWSAGDSVIGVADDGTEGASFWEQTQGDTESTAKIAAEGTGKGDLIGEWKDGGSTKVVDIKTKLDKPVFRNVLTTGAGVAMSDCVFFDSLVKFTACDEPVDVSSFAGAKLAVWIHEDEENQKTNLFVTAGYFTDAGNTTVVTNYDCGAIKSKGIVPGEWCRLTIKTIADITNGDGAPGFAIFVNGDDANGLVNPVGCSASKGVAGSAITKLNNACAARGVEFIFPSIDQESGDKAKVAGVGFAGQGSVDEVTFAKAGEGEGESREFAKDPEIQMFTINWTEGEITALAINGEPVSISGDSYSYPLIGVIELTVTPTFATGKKMVYDWDNATACKASYANGTITVTDFEAEGQPAIEIETMSSANGATVDGRTYPTIAEAVEYLNGLSGEQTLVIGDAVSATASTDNNITIESETLGSVTIDLHGETIYGADDGEYHYGVIEIDSATDVLITDSLGGGKVVAEAETEQPAVYNYAGTLNVNDGIFDGAVVIYADNQADGSLIGGKYLASKNGEAAATFTLADYVGKGQEKTYEATDGEGDDFGYIVVAEKVIVTFTVTVPELTEGLTIESITTNNVPVDSPVAGDYTLNEGETFTMTYAPADYYKFTDDQETGVREATEETTIVPPVVEMIKYAVTWDDSDANAVAVAKVHGLQIENGQEFARNTEVAFTVTPNPDYEYATAPEGGWTLEEDGTITQIFTVGDEALDVEIPAATEKQQDWPDDPTDWNGKKASEVIPGIPTELANADAGTIAKWATTEGNVDFKVATGIKTEAFLLNIDNASTPEQIQAEKDAFKITAITVAADGSVTITGPDEADYNGKVTIEGKAALTDEIWHPKADNDQFFRATLTVKEIAE